MPTKPLDVVIQQLMADVGPDGGGMTDGELLAFFLDNRDDNALAALVRRHAPMVWGVCCRLLYNHHDAEDAFQATFLVLVRKAADVPRKAVANWLYGVARQTAVRLRATTAKQRRRETQVVDMPEPNVPEVRDADLHAMLDEELSRLPDHYRGALVLCDLEGLTRKEAARQLGIPEGSVASRLARARALLAKRLRRRAVVLSCGSLAALSAGTVSASAPPTLVVSTIKAAGLLAAGQAAGIVSAKVAALAEGMVKAMFVSKIKSALAVVLAAGLILGGIGAGIGLPTNPVAVAQQPGVSADDVKKPTDKKLPEKRPKKRMDTQKQATKQTKLRLLIDQVLAAYGGEAKLKQLKLFTETVKQNNGRTLTYFVQPPDHFRVEYRHKDEATRICILLPYGRQWWKQQPSGGFTPVQYSGAELPMEYWLDHVKFFGPRQVLRLKDAGHRVTLLDEEIKIDGRAAVGVEVTYTVPNKQFTPLLKMYFDKETHLLVILGGTYYRDYKKFDGIPIAQKESQPGYMETEVTAFRALEKIDPELFKQP